MFVMTEKDIKEETENQHERYGIIIPTDLLQQYTERWFNRLTFTRCIEKFMDTSRPLKNVTFCSTLSNYIRQLNTETISCIIQTANSDFINKMFVMIEADLDDTSKDRYEYFGIVIPDNLLQQYIERWFECLTTTMDLEKYINKNRLMKNITFCTALRIHMKQLNIEKICSLIQTAKGDFINKMFVITEDDVDDKSEIIYERIKDNTDNRYEYFGCVIPDSLLQKYIERWLNCVEKSDSAMEYMNCTRPLNNVTFRNELRTFLRQLNTEKIWTLIGTKGRDFLNTMFVMNEEDINDNAKHQYECFGIVIPFDLLNLYIERWLDRTIYKYETDKFSVKEAMAVNRPMRNVAFRSALCSYIKRLSAKKSFTAEELIS
ncbi:unnamed protein product [Mytilus edulis]|uniref:Uncharacterized protein n=1 Tax=Mytilus edulis TaxID=6550 RepID=A0A8S3R0N9_MYTED|nr:unnamed protein product [Mytilus edulis]